MNGPLFCPRSIRPVIPSSFAPSTKSWPQLSRPQAVARRHQSSSRRTTQRMRLKPAPFAAETSEMQDHIIFNPPSSAPNVYHTPAKFLPPGDSRRTLFSANNPAQTSISATANVPGSSRTSSSSPLSDQSSSKSVLPPPLKTPYTKKYHLTEADFEAMRQLRLEDSYKWTKETLAEKFGCSEFFARLVISGLTPHIKAQKDKELEEIKKKWGPRKTAARQDRQRRREMWGRDV